MHNILGKFSKEKDKLKIIEGNQGATYNKFGLGYETKSNAEFFNKTWHANNTYKYNMSKCNYYWKSGHISSSCYMRKNHESNVKKKLLLLCLDSSRKIIKLT